MTQSNESAISTFNLKVVTLCGRSNKQGLGGCVFRRTFIIYIENSTYFCGSTQVTNVNNMSGLVSATIAGAQSVCRTRCNYALSLIFYFPIPSDWRRPQITHSSIARSNYSQSLPIPAFHTRIRAELHSP